LNLEEKLEHLKDLSMEEARAEGNHIIDDYRKALEKVENDHIQDANKQSALRIKAETMNSKQRMNQTLVKAGLDMKRDLSKLQQELRDNIFGEVRTLLEDFMKTPDYEAFLKEKIKAGQTFAGNDTIHFYVNASDEGKIAMLSAATGASIQVSDRDFMGGVRGVIDARNILIDNSFTTLLRNEYDSFLFGGG